MAYGIIVSDNYVLFLYRIELSRNASSGLVLHEGLVQKLHEEKREDDEEVDYSRKHDHHREDASTVSDKVDVAVTQGRHGGQNPIKTLHEVYFSGFSDYKQFRRHQVPVDRHVDRHEEKQNKDEPKDARGISSFIATLENAWNRVNDVLHKRKVESKIRFNDL